MSFLFPTIEESIAAAEMHFRSYTDKLRTQKGEAATSEMLAEAQAIFNRFQAYENASFENPADPTLEKVRRQLVDDLHAADQPVQKIVGFLTKEATLHAKKRTMDMRRYELPMSQQALAEA